MGGVIINMRVLAIAAVLILASSSEARRRPGNGGRPQKQRQPKEDPGTIIRCMAENFGQDDKIQECRDCFKALGKDVMSETNLPKAKECGQEKVKEFVMENAGPKALKMIGNMLGDKDDDEDQ